MDLFQPFRALAAQVRGAAAEEDEESLEELEARATKEAEEALLGTGGLEDEEVAGELGSGDALPIEERIDVEEIAEEARSRLRREESE